MDARIKPLGFKQKESNERFKYVWNNITDIVSKQDLDDNIQLTLSNMNNVLSGKKYGLAWSGGKDSVVVEFLLRQLQKDFPSCIGMTKGLEYPEFMQFVTMNMPNDLKVYMTKHDIQWLSENLNWLFPDTKQAAKWFKAVQHSAQNSFFNDKELDILVTGRRTKDYNTCGKNGIYKNKTTQVVRFSPIFNWTHEMTLACIKYYNLPLAPFYSWPNGWVVGSGNWAARQWCGSIHNGWAQVYQIDKTVVKNAAKHIPSAKEFLECVD